MSTPTPKPGSAELRKAAKCVFLATEESVARDLRDLLLAGADAMDSNAALLAENARLREALREIRCKTDQAPVQPGTSGIGDRWDRIGEIANAALAPAQQEGGAS